MRARLRGGRLVQSVSILTADMKAQAQAEAPGKGKRKRASPEARAKTKCAWAFLTLRLACACAWGRGHENKTLPSPPHVGRRCLDAIGARPVDGVADDAAGRGPGDDTPGGAAAVIRLRRVRRRRAATHAPWPQPKAVSYTGRGEIVRGGVAVGSRGGSGLCCIRCVAVLTQVHTRAPPLQLFPHEPCSTIAPRVAARVIPAPLPDRIYPLPL
jgi:hypothetical protein